MPSSNLGIYPRNGTGKDVVWRVISSTVADRTFLPAVENNVPHLTGRASGSGYAAFGRWLDSVRLGGRVPAVMRVCIG